MPEQGLTEQQRKWMASVRASLPEKTGKSMDEWVAIARACPETQPRARQRWFKAHHGLGVNYFSFIEHETRTRDAGAAGGPDWQVGGDAEALGSALWSDPGAAEIFRAVEAVVAELPDVVVGQRKGFTAFSRRFQFASARPVRGGGLRLGLAVAPDADAPDADPRLKPPAKSEGWSERLTAVVELSDREQVDAALAHLLRAAWERS